MDIIDQFSEKMIDFAMFLWHLIVNFGGWLLKVTHLDGLIHSILGDTSDPMTTLGFFGLIGLAIWFIIDQLNQSVK